MSDVPPAVPGELELLRRIFGPDGADYGDRGGPRDLVAGERAFQFGDERLIRGAPVFWVECRGCDQEGPDAGTADSALAWVKVHGPGCGPDSFLLLSEAPVRVAPAVGR